jgi:SAM-dependent methyltransferase
MGQNSNKPALDGGILTENLYLAHKSIKDEIPRLLKQARLLFHAEKDFLGELFAPCAPGKFLDLGSGTGIYLSLVAPFLKGHEIQGVDISTNMLDYARLCFPEFTFSEASIYSTPFDDNTFDIVHASFVFIHLREPGIALREIARILKPGGMLIVVDIDDSTFKGPVPIINLINAYDDVYEGNRKIMPELAARAREQNFSLKMESVIAVDNAGSDAGLSGASPHFHIGRMTMWGLLSFMGQRSEVKDQFDEAQACYMSGDVRVQASITNQVYILNS